MFHILIGFGAGGSIAGASVGDFIGNPFYWHAVPLGVLAVGQSFGMPLFMFISGYFTPSSLKRKGVHEFIKDRLARLGIPLAVAYFVLYPLCVSFAINVIAGGKARISVPPVSPAKAGAAKSGADVSTAPLISAWTYAPAVGVMWFPQLLLYLSVAYALLFPTGSMLATSAGGATRKSSRIKLPVTCWYYLTVLLDTASQ